MSTSKDHYLCPNQLCIKRITQLNWAGHMSLVKNFRPTKHDYMGRYLLFNETKEQQKSIKLSQLKWFGACHIEHRHVIFSFEEYRRSILRRKRQRINNLTTMIPNLVQTFTIRQCSRIWLSQNGLINNKRACKCKFLRERYS